MHTPLGRIVIYTKKIDDMVAFYSQHFGFTEHRIEGDRIVELRPSGGGATINLHPAAKSQKIGQVLVKLTFDVEDVDAFVARAKTQGLIFTGLHRADGYSYANTKDPSGNPVSVSSRAFVVK